MDLNNGASDNNVEEPSVVNEGAFWHTNMDLYYGFSPGDVVEVEHEPDKYWLASIRFCFRHLLLLKWVGNYGSEFWVDTSNQNSSLSSTTSSSGAPSEPYGNPKRVYSLGYHQLPSLRSQFTLEKPRRILEKPSLYNPAKDPYAGVRTVDDLLVHEVEETNNDDTFASKSTSDTASLALAKCKSKINYGQEDEDELEAALQALTGLDQRTESPQLDSNNLEHVPPAASQTRPATAGNSDQTLPIANHQPSTATEDPSSIKTQDQASDQQQSHHQVYWEDDHLSRYLDLSENEIQDRKERPLLYMDQERSAWRSIMRDIEHHYDKLAKNDIAVNMFKFRKWPIEGCFTSCNRVVIEEPTNRNKFHEVDQEDGQQDGAQRDELSLKLCKDVLEEAQQDSKYWEVDSSGLQKIGISHPVRPRILYDLGGANHERLLVRGTLLSVRHTIENAVGHLDLYEWIAIVVKNVGGRLTLRWFLCDEPKFKQGRLEMKSCVSKLVAEDIEQQQQQANSNNVSENGIDYTLSDDNNGTILPSLSDLRSPPHNSGDLISSKSLTFSMHFCNPRIMSVYEHGDVLVLPNDIASHLKRAHGLKFVRDLEQSQLDYIFDTRRKNLDRDRLLIDELIEAVHTRSPRYISLTFGSKDFKGRREVLMSCPRMTKLLRATIQRELEPGVFEVHSEPLIDTDEIIKFIYPYDSSYTILPLEWSNSNSDCLSVHPSRNPSPTPAPSEDKTDNGNAEESHPPTEVSTIQTSIQQLASPQDQEFNCCLNYELKEPVESRFKVMDQLEIFHPTSDHIICTGRIRKVVFPLLWIQLSSDCYTLIPFDQTDIYPAGWCESHGLKLVSLLPPRRRSAAEIDGKVSRQRDSKRSRKKVKISHKSKGRGGASGSSTRDDATESENFDLVNLEDRQAGIDYILKERSAYVKIFFNHKCFTGPSLSKSKICTLPQYVGPGPMRLVIEEVVTKLISVGYVPPRVLNDLCSDSFKELLIERNLTNTSPMEFKAKYQKRVHREKVPVCINPDDVKLYCECVCEHIKCCYNLFGLNLYDGEFCPSNCRSLTKSNKFMKRATYYRDKARQGEVPSIPTSNNGGDNNSQRDSNKTSSNNGKRKTADLMANGVDSPEINSSITSATANNATTNVVTPSLMETPTPEMDNDTTATRARYNGRGSSESTSSSNISRSDEEIDTETLHKVREWTIEDVARYLEERQLGIFKTYMKAEGIDGQALMLLDRPAIEEHFQLKTRSEITQEDVNKLCDTVDLFKTFSKIY